MPMVKLNVKTNSMQFEDKRIEANAGWNIKELKGKLSELYPTSTEEQKLIYSGKLLSDNSVLKDVLREYDGQEAHTVHLVFTPKNSKSKFDVTRSSAFHNTSTSSTSSSAAATSGSPAMAAANMNNSTNELRQRHVTAASASHENRDNAQQQQNTAPIAAANIPTNFSEFQQFNANNILAQQYAMQYAWMQQAYTNYMSQVASYYEQNQQQLPQNFAYLPPQMPYMSPLPIPSGSPGTSAEPAVAANASPQVQQPIQPAQQPVAEPENRRFPNIVQEEQENRDWLDILYSMSRCIILLCLVYFYSSPIRCIGVILIGVLLYLYHIYKQNQTRLNNNNNRAVNLNQQAAPAAPRQENNDERGQDRVDGDADVQPSVAVAAEEPQVPFATIFKTFVISFFSSIIPEAPAL